MNFLNEAFKQLDMLSEDVFTLDTKGIEEMRDFVDTSDAEVATTIDVIDPEVDEVSELADNYIGKIILECPVCHSTIFKAAEDVHIDEVEDMANMDEECPYCFSLDGYHVIGKVEPATFEETGKIPEDEEISEDEEIPEDVEIVDSADLYTEEEPVEEVIDIEDEDIEDTTPDELDEACINEENAWDKLKKYLYTKDDVAEELNKDGSCLIESAWDDIIGVLKNRGIELAEDLNNITFDTDEQHIEMRQEDDGKVVIETTPIHGEDIDDEETVEGEEEVVDAEDIIPEDDNLEVTETEVLSELTPEDKDDLMMDTDEIAEEEIPEEESEIEDFDEESFDELTESYLKKTYGNIKSYKTVRVIDNDNKLIVEGYIRFASGKLRKTNFILESKMQGNKIRFIGKSDISGNKNAYKVSGSVKGKKFITESMNYNYITKTKTGTPKRVYGTIKR